MKHWPAGSIGFMLFFTSLEADAEQPKAQTDAKPPYERLLQGDEAKQAAELDKKIAKLEAADNYDEALKLQQQVLELRAKSQGADHWQSITAKWYVEQLKKIAALTPDKRAGWSDAARGILTIESLNAKARYAEALALVRDYAKWSRDVLGEEHPETAGSYFGVAHFLKAAGKAAEAEPLFRQALTIRRKALGEEHPDTALSYNSIADNLDDLGKVAEAEPLYRKALEICCKALGEDHSDTASSYNNVALNLQAQGKAAEAEPLFRKALQIFFKVLGEEHSHTATSYNNVALNLQAQGESR